MTRFSSGFIAQQNPSKSKAMDEDVIMAGTEEATIAFYNSAFAAQARAARQEHNLVPVAEWQSRLMGKKMATVYGRPTAHVDDADSCLEADLLQPYLMIAPGHGYYLCNYNKNRLKLRLDDDGKVFGVQYG